MTAYCLGPRCGRQLVSFSVSLVCLLRRLLPRSPAQGRASMAPDI